MITPAWTEQSIFRKDFIDCPALTRAMSSRQRKGDLMYCLEALYLFLKTKNPPIKL